MFAPSLSNQGTVAYSRKTSQDLDAKREHVPYRGVLPIGDKSPSPMPDFLPNPGAFFLVTVILGGGAAWQSGMAIARTWRPLWHAVLYMFILGAAVRFIHYALFDGVLLSLPAYALDTAVAIGCAASGFRIARARQMARQYGFLNRAG
jgi:hypothetical protein